MKTMATILWTTLKIVKCKDRGGSFHATRKSFRLLLKDENCCKIRRRYLTDTLHFWKGHDSSIQRNSFCCNSRQVFEADAISAANVLYIGGERFWLAKLLSAEQMKPPSNRLVFIYRYWTPLYGNQKVIQTSSLCKEYLAAMVIKLSLDERMPTLIVIDDDVSRQGRFIAFTRGTFHLNRSVIITVQNVFSQSTLMRTMSLSSHYLVIWKQPRYEVDGLRGYDW